MLFPSFTFLLAFLPITLAGYYLLGAKTKKGAQTFLIGASLIFYSWFNPSYFLILAGSILGNYFISLLLWKYHSRVIFIIGVILNLLLLGYYKYCDFFIANINSALSLSLPFLHIVLPLGISFFTFQQISFLHGVYTNSLKERYSFLTYALFVSFFPQLVAGPIVLPDEMMPQFDKEENRHPQAKNLAAGLFVFSLGLAKKILLADFFAEIADAGFGGGILSFTDSWKTALAYTFQIYFDFSGYCDMAIGLGLLFNIRLPDNFSSPYLSASIGEFWRRWHITLGRFLKTYIYIPLGGSKKGHFLTGINLMATFLISGLWHGASWLFVLWGGIHGAALVVNHFWSKVFHLKMPISAAKILTFFFVAVSWVFFRAENMVQAKELFRGMFLPEKWGGHFTGFETGLFLAGAGIILFLPTASSRVEKFRPSWVNGVVAAGLLTASIFCFVKTSPFIYFNF